jgi:hypothetical protein
MRALSSASTKTSRGQVTWHHFRLGSLITPVEIARDPEQASRARIPHKAVNRPLGEAVGALVAVGINFSADLISEVPAGTA